MAILTGNVIKDEVEGRCCKARVVLDQQNKFLRQPSRQMHQPATSLLRILMV